MSYVVEARDKPLLLAGTSCYKGDGDKTDKTHHNPTSYNSLPYIVFYVLRYFCAYILWDMVDSLIAKFMGPT